MNDRFKFRIYDKGNEQYLDPEDMDCVCHLPNGCFTIATWDGIQGDMKYWADEDIVVEMSTGLKDKNSNLIYEGDLIKDRGEIKYQIMWKNAQFVAVAAKEFDYMPDNLLNQKWLDTWKIEIIGNIHDKGSSNE